MKKIIGIVLTLCMLCTMASAATITNAVATPDTDEMTVSITYDALANAQATMLAYVVADGSTVEEFPAFVDTTTTPIVGIDQATSDGTFDFKVADDFEGTIAVMIGGTGIDEPAEMIVTFAQTSEGVEITLNYGDVNGDGSADEADASLILQRGVGLIQVFMDQQKREIPKEAGDVNGDGETDEADASLILQKGVGLIAGFTDQNKNPLTTYTYMYVAPAGE